MAPCAPDSAEPRADQFVLQNETVRQIVHLSIGGAAVKLRFSNTFGTAPLLLRSVFIAPRVSGDRIESSAGRTVSFAGKPEVTIAPGATVTSDVVDMPVTSDSDLAVTFFVPQKLQAPAIHYTALQTSYVAKGDQSAAATLEEPRRVTLDLILTGVDVASRTSPGAIVAFGDSITDGTCTTLDAHDRWEDWVSVRLDSTDAPGAPGSGRFNQRGLKAVVNEGIGGNTVTRTSSPPPDSAPGVERLERDVLSHTGVTHVVLFMGTNDIRREASAAQVIDGMRNIIERVKARGLSIIGATIIPRHNRPPAGTNTGWNPAKTAIRNEVNRWIRTEAAFDDVLDFDKVVRDPADPDLINPPLNCGDGIHPSPAGYYLMGQSVDLRLFDDSGRH